MTGDAMVGWRMTLNDDDLGEGREHPQEGTVGYRVWRYLDPMVRVKGSRKGLTLEARLIGFVLIAVWINAGIVVWRNLSG